MILFLFNETFLLLLKLIHINYESLCLCTHLLSHLLVVQPEGVNLLLQSDLNLQLLSGNTSHSPDPVDRLLLPLGCRRGSLPSPSLSEVWSSEPDEPVVWNPINGSVVENGFGNGGSPPMVTSPRVPPSTTSPEKLALANTLDLKFIVDTSIIITW